MGQNPIPAFAYGQSPTRAPVLIQVDSDGYVILAASSGGNNFFVNETTGSDSNPGTAAEPFATLAAAQAAATANNGDTVFLMGTVHVTATVLWAKNGVNLIGLLAGSDNDRSRISSSGSTVFTPMVNVTAQGCLIKDIGTFYGYANASAQVCWTDTGGRNKYDNVQFLGGGNVTAAAQAGCRSLTVGGNGENEFLDCTFGLDTVARATNPNATLEFLGGTQRNKFIRPVFQMYSSLATNVHVKAAAGAVDRSQYFYDPIFANAVDSGATGLNADVLWDVAAGGNLIIAGNGISVGATAIAVAGPVYVNGAVPVATTSNIGIKAT